MSSAQFRKGNSGLLVDDGVCGAILAGSLAGEAGGSLLSKKQVRKVRTGKFLISRVHALFRGYVSWIIRAKGNGVVMSRVVCFFLFVAREERLDGSAAYEDYCCYNDYFFHVGSLFSLNLFCKRPTFLL